MLARIPQQPCGVGCCLEGGVVMDSLCVWLSRDLNSNHSRFLVVHRTPSDSTCLDIGTSQIHHFVAPDHPS